MERLIPISKRQHDAVNQMVASIAAQQRQLEMVANTILLGLDEDIPPSGISGARVVDGVCVLAIEIPDPASMP